MVRVHPGLLLVDARIRLLVERLGPVSIGRGQVSAGSIPAPGTDGSVGNWQTTLA